MASTIDWPESLPQLSDVEFEVIDTRVISPTEMGPAKMRNRYTFAPINVTGRLVCSYQQTVEFLNFYSTTLVNGSLTFNWEHPVTDAASEMRFVSVGRFRLFKPGHHTERTWFADVVMERVGAA